MPIGNTILACVIAILMGAALVFAVVNGVILTINETKRDIYQTRREKNL